MEDGKIQILDRVVKILDCFTIERHELGVREVARLAGLSPSVCGRLMQALVQHRLLVQNAATREYAIGSKSLAWSEIYSTHLDVRTLALPFINELLLKTQETISLYILDGSERLCVERIESAQNVRVVARIGRRIPLYAGSAGKVLLAFLPQPRRDEIIAQTDLVPFTDQTIIDKDRLSEELKKIRQQGYAFSSGEWVSDAAGVAVPIFNQRSDVIAALTVSGPSNRFTPEAVGRHVQSALLSAERISIEMGYMGNLFSQFALRPK